MTLAASGEMSIGGTATDRSINVELGRSATASSNLNETTLRSLASAGASGTQISLSDFYGKSNDPYVGSVTSWGANPTIGVPAGASSLDILILFVMSDGTVPTPAGWTSWSTSTSGSGLKLAIFYKFKDTTTSVSLTNTGNCGAVMVAYKRFNGMGWGSGWAAAAGNSTSISTTAFDPNPTNAEGRTVITVAFQIQTTGTFTTPAGWSQRALQNAANSYKISVADTYSTATSIGATWGVGGVYPSNAITFSIV